MMVPGFRNGSGGCIDKKAVQGRRSSGGHQNRGGQRRPFTAGTYFVAILDVEAVTGTAQPRVSRGSCRKSRLGVGSPP